MKISFLILILFVLIGCKKGSDQEKSWSDPIQSFENNLLPAIVFKGEPIEPKSIYERMEFYKVPGVSVVVYKNGQIEWANGYGFLSYEGSGRTDPYTLFHSPGIENFYLAGALMTMVEQNRVNLDEKVSFYLKSNSSLLVRDLIGNVDQQSTLIDLIEKVSGLPYSQFVKEKFIDPFGLKNSTFDFYPSAASGHLWDGTKIKEFKDKGLWTIPSDLAQFSNDINAIYASKTIKVLTKRTVDLLVDSFSNPNEEIKRMVLEGNSKGFYTKWVSTFNEEGLGYAIFTNSENGKNLSDELERSLSKTYGWSFNQPDTLARLPWPEEQFKVFQGRYFNEIEQNQYEVIAYSDHLRLHPVGEETKKMEYYPIGETNFVEKNTGRKINFELNESGILEALIFDKQIRYERIKAL